MITPVYTTGFPGGPSVFGIQKAMSQAPSNLPRVVNTSARVPAGWTINPLDNHNLGGYAGNGGFHSGVT